VSSTTSPGDRILTLDLIRGIAVMGIFSVNVVDFAMIEAAYFNPAAYGGRTGVDLLVWIANMLIIDGKMRSLFSMLCGASMLLVIDRAEAKVAESGWTVHWPRMIVLLAFGLLHFVAVWTGDILQLYAISGLILFAFRNQPVKSLLGWAVGFIVVSMALMIAIGITFHNQQLAAEAPNASAEVARLWQVNSGTFLPDAAKLEQDRALHLGSWEALSLHRLNELAGVPGQTLFLLPETLGLMLIGMAAFRSGFFTGEWSREQYRHFALWSIPLGLAGHVALIAADLWSNFSIPILFGGFIGAMSPFRIVQALGYAALAILLARPGGWLTERIAEVGRTAFSNYLGTSLVAATVFYGWGFGLYGSVSRAEAWLLVPPVWAAMLAWSKPWLGHFRYGPFEWAWRSLARWERQPMRLASV
jgi:uncharacterized protein